MQLPLLRRKGMAPALGIREPPHTPVGHAIAPLELARVARVIATIITIITITPAENHPR